MPSCSILGWDRLLELTASEWLEDIKTYQLPQILKGVGPMYHVTQLGKSLYYHQFKGSWQIQYISEEKWETCHRLHCVGVEIT